MRRNDRPESPERVAGLLRNGWPQWTGIGGRIRPEQAAGFRRIRQGGLAVDMRQPEVHSPRVLVAIECRTSALPNQARPAADPDAGCVAWETKRPQGRGRADLGAPLPGLPDRADRAPADDGVAVRRMPGRGTGRRARHHALGPERRAGAVTEGACPFCDVAADRCFYQGERVVGQTIFHLHVHVIPRYAGDVPDPRGGVRHVIPGRANYLAGRDSRPARRDLPHRRPLVPGARPTRCCNTCAGTSTRNVDIAVAFFMERESSGVRLGDVDEGVTAASPEVDVFVAVLRAVPGEIGRCSGWDATGAVSCSSDRSRAGRSIAPEFVGQLDRLGLCQSAAPGSSPVEEHPKVCGDKAEAVGV